MLKLLLLLLISMSLTQIGTRAAVDGERIRAILAQRVSVIEHETVAANLQRGGAILASPVPVEHTNAKLMPLAHRNLGDSLVARLGVRVEAEVIRAIEVALLHDHGGHWAAGGLLGSTARGQRDRHATGLRGDWEVLQSLRALSHGSGGCEKEKVFCFNVN